MTIIHDPCMEAVSVELLMFSEGVSHAIEIVYNVTVQEIQAIRIATFALLSSAAPPSFVYREYSVTDGPLPIDIHHGRGIPTRFVESDADPRMDLLAWNIQFESKIASQLASLVYPSRFNHRRCNRISILIEAAFNMLFNILDAVPLVHAPRLEALLSDDLLHTFNIVRKVVVE